MPTPPQQFGPYRVLRELGKGGMGMVYEGVHVETQARVAIKTLPASAVDERFLREGELLARLNHRNIVRVHAADLRGNPPYLVQDLLPGPDLSERLRGGPLPIEEAVTITVALARAVAHAHAQGVLHRDLKPQNVVFDAHGAPVLIDFGLAKPTGEAEQERLTATGEVLGTPNTMAPEQAEGRKETSPATDVYGLGGLLYSLLTGAPPIEPRASLLGTLQSVVNDPPRSPRSLRPEIPRPIERECLRALAKAPADRHLSAEALADALEVATVGRDAPPWPIAIGVVLLVLAGLIGVASSTQPTLNGGDRQDPDAVARLHAAALLRDPAVPLWGDEVAAAISATLAAPDDASRVLSGLAALARGETEAARAQDAALEAPDEPPGCALRGALAALDDPPEAALPDLERAREADVRRWDLLAWSVRARRRAGFQSHGEARRALSDLDRCARADVRHPGHDADRAWAHLKLDKLDEARRGAISARDERLLVAMVQRLVGDGNDAEALATAKHLGPTPTPQRVALAAQIVASVDTQAFRLEADLPKLQVARRLDPTFRLSRARSLEVASALDSTRLSAEILDQFIALTQALPHSLPVTRRVFVASMQLRTNRPLRRRLLPVAEQLMRVAEGTPQYLGTAIEVCGFYNGVDMWGLGAETARRALDLLAPLEPPRLLRRLADGLRHSGQRAGAIKTYRRMIEILPDGDPQRLRAQLDLGVMFFNHPDHPADHAKAPPLLLRFLREAKLPQQNEDAYLLPSLYIFIEATVEPPIDLPLAQETVERALQYFPKAPHWMLRAAWVAHAAQRTDAAWALVQRARARLDHLHQTLRHSPRMAALHRRVRGLTRDRLSDLGPIVKELESIGMEELKHYRGR